MRPTILASDFDGVICNGLEEYFASTLRAYQQIWHQDIGDRDSLDSLASLATEFKTLRPVIETGWEMPVLLRALVLECDPKTILSSWHSVRDRLKEKENLDPKFCAQCLDGVRDDWIKNSLDSWLDLHSFYPGVIDKLNEIIASDLQFFIVTTKEGRFVKQLLQQQGIELGDHQVIGKESRRPKYETLRMIRDEAGSSSHIWFIEDRIQALNLVKEQPDLQSIKLFLADWGYNTQSERNLASGDRHISLISPAQFRQDYPKWLV